MGNRETLMVLPESFDKWIHLKSHMNSQLLHICTDQGLVRKHRESGHHRREQNTAINSRLLLDFSSVMLEVLDTVMVCQQNDSSVLLISALMVYNTHRNIFIFSQKP